MSLNKKGDIPVTILVIGVFAICVLAIFSFIQAADNFNSNFRGVGLIETVNAIEEEIRFEKFKSLEGFSDLIILDKHVAGRVEVKVDEDAKFLISAKYVGREGMLFWIKEKELVSVEYTPKE